MEAERARLAMLAVSLERITIWGLLSVERYRFLFRLLVTDLESDPKPGA